MKKYHGIILAVAVAVMLAACSGKSSDSAKETGTGPDVQAQQEKRQPDIQILDETPAATQPETGIQESGQAANTEGDWQVSGGAAGGIVADGTASAGEEASAKTESAKAYPVEAFEKTMYATTNVNVRTSYTTQSEVLTTLKPGHKVKVTGKSANGWMRIIYNGKDAYIYQRYLSSQAPVVKTGTAVASRKDHSQAQPPAPDAVNLPGNTQEGTTEAIEEIPIVEPAPIMAAPGQSSPASQSGPGVVSPESGSGQTGAVVQGKGPGM